MSRVAVSTLKITYFYKQINKNRYVENTCALCSILIDNCKTNKLHLKINYYKSGN